MSKAMAIALLVVLTAFAGSAATKYHQGLTYSTTAVTTGIWSSKFTKCKAAAERNGRPLIVLWANSGCSHCDSVCSSLASSALFKSWMASSGAYFVFGLGSSGRENAAIKNFARDSSGYFPYIAVYLKQKGYSSVSVYRTLSGNGRDASSILSKIKTYLKSYVRIRLKAGTGGTVTQVGYRKIGNTVSLVAKPTSKYKFKGWYDSAGKRVSTAATYRLKVKKAVTYTAKFQKR